ncbi:MAG: DNA topoisomerase IV subunit A [Phycisphaerae bacterium]|nr:DNA topoisomerase IV subunit A [Phycisphaerae bacterium]
MPKTPKKPKASASAATPSPRRAKRDGQATQARLAKLADAVVALAEKQKDPFVDIPIRALSNVSFNEKTRYIEMGDKTQRRNFFNYGQAKRFMQTVLVASKCKQLVDEDKTASIRQIYYLAKHTIKGTNEKTFDDQDESDPVLEDLEVALDSLREELHIFASNRGNLVGPITLVDSGNELDCTRMGSAGYAVPSIVEPDIIQFKKCKAKFILHVEKDTVWRRFYEDRFWEKHNCIVSHGSGQPTRGMRRLLHRMHNELKLPVYALLDCDPWGYYIYSVIKQGSINLAYESRRMAVPEAVFIGVSAFDYERYDLSDDVKLGLDSADVKRCKQILAYPWFAGKRPWEKEIKKLVRNGFKMEVEALCNKSLSFVTEEYVPAKLKDRKQWLD